VSSTSDVHVGIDIGTSAVKVAAFNARGHVIASSRASLPQLNIRGAAATQPLAELVRITERVVRDVAYGASPVLVGLATQRDTAIVLDAEGVPGRDLISWRDVRHVRHGSIWDALAAEPGVLPDGPVRVRSLSSYLAERWTGEAAETEGTRSRHLGAAALDRLRALRSDVDVPRSVGAGEPIAGARDNAPLPRGVPLILSSGDKNAELVGAGVTARARAGISLGSAISLGMMVRGDRPQDIPGAVISAAALADGWNVETGLVVGLQGLDLLRRMSSQPELAPDGRWRTDLWCIPAFAGALDQPRALGMLVGLRETTTASDLARAWAQGVACELARLAPCVEAAGGVIEDVRVYGGGADAGWQRLLADVLDRPVRLVDDPWCGARGALIAALLRRGRPELADALLAEAEATMSDAMMPDAATRARVARYRERYQVLLAAGIE
jgi:sugar (pentulose or hexulose) kinase